MIKRSHKSYKLHQNALYLQSILIKLDKVMAQTSMTVIRTRSIPFAIKANESKEDKVTVEAIEAFENMCKTAKENNIEMSLDEINAEIKEVRRLRKERNGVRSY